MTAPERSADVEIAIQLKEENKAFQSREIRSQLSTLLENGHTNFILSAGFLVHQNHGS